MENGVNRLRKELRPNGGTCTTRTLLD